MTNRLNRRLNNKRRREGELRQPLTPFERVSALVPTVLAWGDRTAAPVLPGAVSLTSPSNSATPADFTPTFSWESALNADTYDFQISTASNFSALVADETELATPEFTPIVDLDNATLYYWRVRGVNAEGAGEWSSSRSFTVTVLPEQVSLTSPNDAATVQDSTPTFTWGSAANADTYEIQVASDSGFTTVVRTQSAIATTSYTSTTLTDATYYWRVRGANAAGNGAWSTARSVVIQDVVWLMYDNFSSGVDAPMPAEYTLDVGGKMVKVVDTGGASSIAGGIFTRRNTGNAADPIYVFRQADNSGWARAAGRMLRLKFRRSYNTVVFGWGSNANGGSANAIHCIDSQGASYQGSGVFTNSLGLSAAVYYDAAILLFPEGGAALFIKGGEGAANTYNNWKMSWYDPQPSTTPLFPMINGDAELRVDYIGIRDLQGSTFLSGNALASHYISGATSTIQSWTHPTEFWMSFTVTTKPSSGNIEIEFRKQDANNKFLLQINGTSFTLFRYDAGVPTQLGTYTTTVNNGDRFALLMNTASNEIRVMFNRTSRISTGSQTAYAASTDGGFSSFGVGGVVSDTRIFDRNLSSSLTAEFDLGITV